MNFTPSKLLWLMVTSKTCWDTETFVLACITGVLWAKRGEHGISCELRSSRLAHKGPELCRLPLFKEVRTCRKTFEILRAKKTCKKWNYVQYTLSEPKISNLYPSAGRMGHPYPFSCGRSSPREMTSKYLTFKYLTSIRLVKYQTRQRKWENNWQVQNTSHKCRSLLYW